MRRGVKLAGAILVHLLLAIFLVTFCKGEERKIVLPTVDKIKSKILWQRDGEPDVNIILKAMIFKAEKLKNLSNLSPEIVAEAFSRWLEYDEPFLITLVSTNDECSDCNFSVERKGSAFRVRMEVEGVKLDGWFGKEAGNIKIMGASSVELRYAFKVTGEFAVFASEWEDENTHVISFWSGSASESMEVNFEVVINGAYFRGRVAVSFSERCTIEPEGFVLISGRKFSFAGKCDGIAEGRLEFAPTSDGMQSIIDIRRGEAGKDKSVFEKVLARSYDIRADFILNAIELEELSWKVRNFLLELTGALSPLSSEIIEVLVRDLYLDDLELTMVRFEGIRDRMKETDERVYLRELTLEIFDYPIVFSGEVDLADIELLLASLYTFSALSHYVLSMNLDISMDTINAINNYLSSRKPESRVEGLFMLSRALCIALNSSPDFMRWEEEEELSNTFKLLKMMLTSLVNALSVIQQPENTDGISYNDGKDVFILGTKVGSLAWARSTTRSIDNVLKSIDEGVDISSLEILNIVRLLKIFKTIFEFEFELNYEVFKLNLKALLQNDLRDMLPAWTPENFVIEWECGADWIEGEISNLGDDFKCKTEPIDSTHFYRELELKVISVGGVPAGGRNPLYPDGIPKDGVSARTPYILFQDPSFGGALKINMKALFGRNPCGPQVYMHKPEGLEGICELNALLAKLG